MEFRVQTPSILRTVNGRSEFAEDAVEIPDGWVTMNERPGNLQRSPFALVEALHDRTLNFGRIVEVPGVPRA